jgi:hypothetical protein
LFTTEFENAKNQLDLRNKIEDLVKIPSNKDNIKRINDELDALKNLLDKQSIFRTVKRFDKSSGKFVNDKIVNAYKLSPEKLK